MRKSISFRSGDKDVFNFLKNKENASQYIIRLIRYDMTNKSKKEDIIREIVKQELRLNNSNTNVDLLVGNMFD